MKVSLENSLTKRTTSYCCDCYACLLFCQILNLDHLHFPICSQVFCCVPLTPVSSHIPSSPAGFHGRQQSWGVSVWRSVCCPGKRCTLSSDWVVGSLSHTLARACRKNTLLFHLCPQMQTELSACMGRTQPSLHCQQILTEETRREHGFPFHLNCTVPPILKYPLPSSQTLISSEITLISCLAWPQPPCLRHGPFVLWPRQIQGGSAAWWSHSLSSPDSYPVLSEEVLQKNSNSLKHKKGRNICIIYAMMPLLPLDNS